MSGYFSNYFRNSTAKSNGNFFTEDSTRNRFTEDIENSILNDAVKEVKEQCSDETFGIVMGYVMNNKNKEFEELKKEFEKRGR